MEKSPNDKNSQSAISINYATTSTNKQAKSDVEEIDYDTCEKRDDVSSEQVSETIANTRQKEILCEFCGILADKKNYRQHREIHTGKKSYNCSICKKAFRKSSYRAQHERTHTGKKPYTCSICKKPFSTMSSLTRHKRTHTGEKPYKCSKCNKAFSQSCNRAKHERTHTGEKPYACSKCNKAFSSSSNLAQHRKTHTGDNFYTCCKCNKLLSTSHNLTQHEMTQTGKKSYQCDECLEKFSQKSLNQHGENTCNNLNLVCLLCGEKFTSEEEETKHLYDMHLANISV